MDELLEFSIRCAFESGRIQRDHFQKGITIHHKGDINLVTDVDIACQTRIMKLITAAFPGDDVISEEKINYFGGNKNRWIIDPLDGTTNYAHGYPFFCTSIAYEEKGEITIGVVYNPIFNELFFCRKGQGAYLNGEKLGVSLITNIREALLATGFPYDLSTSQRNNIDNFVQFLFKAQAIRRDGSAALNLCYLAGGKFDGFWELNLSPWDTAAGYLMVAEAGGVVTDFVGGRFSIYGREIVASNGHIHDSLLHVLKEDRTRAEAEG
jgi:myo-inositol-1(or 4)-monophosphatase